MRRLFTVLVLSAIALAAGSISAAGSYPFAPPSIRVTPPAPKFTDSERQLELARRRTEVAKSMADKSILILFSAEPRLYTNDVDYVYRQENNLYYLTGLKQDGATLVITKDGAAVNEILFLPKRAPVREAWTGKMYSREQAMQLSGLKTIVDSSERDEFLRTVKDKGPFSSKDGAISIASGYTTLYLLVPNAPTDYSGNREYRAEKTFADTLNGYKIENARIIFGDLRHIKSSYELKLLQHAIDITTEAQMSAWLAAPKSKWEYEVQAEIEYIYRKRNADFWGYPSIVGCGPNATTLHYVESQSEVKPGELLLLDVGADYDHYTADATRTIPVNGKFSTEQADIYRIVFEAQEAVAKATKPGVTFADLTTISNNVLKAGLARLGLIASPDATYQLVDRDGKTVEIPQFKLFSFHGLGHWLGMNVHDVGRYGPPLRAGMVFTNEPGIYIRADALDYMPDTVANKELLAKIRPVFERYKNIGVRIEDDMLVTPNGVEWMTKNLPRKLEDIEAFMAGAK